MDLKIECFDRQTHILVVAKGIWTQSVAQQVIDAARQEADRMGTNRILLDLRDFLPPTDVLTRYETGEYIAEKLTYPYRLAVIGIPASVNRVAEKVAANRGARIMVFYDEATALAWLLGAGMQPIQPQDIGDAK